MLADAAGRRLAVLRTQLSTSPRATASVSQQRTAATGSVWTDVPQAPPDAILGVSEAFKASNNPKKMNLGVGAYRTEEGKPFVLEAIRSAEKKLVNDPSIVKEYLAIGGDPDFCKLTAQLAFGEDSSVLREGRAITVQSLSGTGSLRVGAEFLAKHYPGPKTILTPTPTWANHDKLFPQGGLKIQKYRYYKADTRGLDYEGMIEDLKQAPEQAIVLLHACAHNPTGVDPTPDQWKGILEVVQQRRLLPFFDSAYQGFVTGDLEEDAVALRMFAETGQEMLVAQSYAKNMGLYGERVGALSVVLSDPKFAKQVESQLKSTIRPMYSSPPAHGARIAATILKDPALYEQWRGELKQMAERIKSMRTQLHKALQEAGAPGSWDHVINQRGMFSFTGLNKAQVENMTNKWAIYMTFDGRISMAGVSGAKCQYLAEAIADSYKQ